MIILVLHSGSTLRHAFYETFLHMHLLVVTVALVAVWYHLVGYSQQIWVISAIGSLIGEVRIWPCQYDIFKAHC
jgi:hypothetical protein